MMHLRFNTLFWLVGIVVVLMPSFFFPELNFFHSQLPFLHMPLSWCLPKNVELSNLVRYSERFNRHVTINDRLQGIGATCTLYRALVDSSNKEIYFYYLTDCKNQDPNYDIHAKQDDEMNALRGKYTIVPIECNIPPIKK